MVTRAELAAQYESLPPGALWKTFVIEAHSNGDPGELLSEMFGDDRVTATSDAYMHSVDGEARFVVDHLDARYWSFHTDSTVDVARPLLNRAVQRSRRLDWMWLPSQHLRSVWQDSPPVSLRSDFRGRRLLPPEERVQDLEVELRGTAASDIFGLIQEQYVGVISFDRIGFDLVDNDYGALQEAVNRQGRFVARGDSFEFHQEVIRGVIQRYRRFVEMVEERAVQWVELVGGGAEMRGSAICIRFSKAVPDRDLLLEELFSSREPFRLWGVPIERNGIHEVEAVDLHVGQRVRFDIGDDWLRIYMFDGGCGNSVARLVTNLQHHLDGALVLTDPDLNAALNLAFPSIE